MTTGDAPRRRENPITLVRRLVSGGVNLAKLEVQRARQEMARNLGHLRGGIIKLAIAAALAVTFLIALLAFIVAVLVVIGLWWVALTLVVALVLLALVAFVVFVILGLAALTPLPDWVIALIVFVVFGLLGGFFAYRGLKRIRIGPPEETIASVKEDIEWAKSRLLRRS